MAELFISPLHTLNEIMNKTLAKIKRFLESEDGPTAVEYAIMLSLIVAVCLTAIQAVGTQTSSMFDEISADVHTAATQGGFD